jgi:hypothetical protein
MAQRRRQETIETPGVSLQVCGSVEQVVALSVENTTVGSGLPPFEQIQKFMSARPVHRPNRSWPQGRTT